MDEAEVLGETESVEEEPVDEELLFTQQEIRECFSIFDPKNRGEMPSKFAEKAFGSLGIHLTPFELEDFLEKHDKDGVIVFSAFEDFAIEKLGEIEPFNQLKQCFSVFDPEGEGFLPTDRFKKWMATLGDPLTEPEIKELTRMGDPSNKGMYNYGDVIPLLIY